MILSGRIIKASGAAVPMIGLLVVGGPASAQSTSSVVGKLPLIALQAQSSSGNPLANDSVQVFWMNPQGGTPSQIATGTTDSQGRVMLTAPLTERLKHSASWNGGTMNLAVVVARPHATPLIWNFSRNVSTSATGASLGPATVHVSSNGTAWPWAKGTTYMASAMHSSTSNSTSGSPALDSCQYEPRVASSTVSYTKIGALHNTSDAQAHFTYGQVADSTISAAVSANGTSGWSADGSASISNSQGSAVGITKQDGQWADNGYVLESQFEYVKYHWYSQCTGYEDKYTVDATQWDGGLIVGANEGSWDNNPTSFTDLYAPGANFSTSSESAYNYGGAVSVFGASLSAQSGFSSYVKESWNFSSSATHNQKLYGENNYPPYARRIFAAD